VNIDSRCTECAGGENHSGMPDVKHKEVAVGSIGVHSRAPPEKARLPDVLL
jgi:hypothetical protein